MWRTHRRATCSEESTCVGRGLASRCSRHLFHAQNSPSRRECLRSRAAAVCSSRAVLRAKEVVRKLASWCDGLATRSSGTCMKNEAT